MEEGELQHPPHESRYVPASVSDARESRKKRVRQYFRSVKSLRSEQPRGGPGRRKHPGSSCGFALSRIALPAEALYTSQWTGSEGRTPLKQIVVLGGGFAGVYTARTLEKLTKPDEAVVSLVNRENY